MTEIERIKRDIATLFESMRNDMIELNRKGVDKKGMVKHLEWCKGALEEQLLLLQSARGECQINCVRGFHGGL